MTEILEDDNLKETQEDAIPIVVATPVENEGVAVEEPEELITILGRCGLFSKETDYIPDIVRFDDNIFNAEYYRKKHGKAFPDEWYDIMAQVSKKRFEDLREDARIKAKLVTGDHTITWDK